MSRIGLFVSVALVAGLGGVFLVAGTTGCGGGSPPPDNPDPGGTSPPVVADAAPTIGPTAGGQTITVFGSNFVAPATVLIGGVAATGVPDIPVHWLAVRPTNSEQLFVGTELGVFKSEDAGDTWSIFNTGLPNTVVESLDFKNDDTLVAFTHGRGVFIVELPQMSQIPAASHWGMALMTLLTITAGTVVFRVKANRA